jgi:DNA-binding transcriptional MerR regulator/quercetin dioxygenase-like cupin family protein
MDDTRFKIAEAARMVGVSPSTLRLWEGQGLVESLRSPSGQRHYDRSLIDRLKVIAWLRGEKGLNAAAIRDRLSRRDGAIVEGPAENAARADGAGMKIGQKVRRLRRDAGKTLETVAQSIGVSPSLLSTFERTSQGLSLTALHDLAKHLGTTVAVLSGQKKRRGAALVRKDRWTALPATSSGVTVQVLAEGRTQMECHRFELAPGASSEGAYRHQGEEFIHVLSGSLEIVLDGDSFFELRPGDSFYFESQRSHAWRNSSSGETVLIWVNTPATF